MGGDSSEMRLEAGSGSGSRREQEKPPKNGSGRRRMSKMTLLQGREERKRGIFRSGDLDATKRFICFLRVFDRHSWKTNVRIRKDERERGGGEMRSSQAIPRLLKGKARETLDRFGASIQACSENNNVYNSWVSRGLERLRGYYDNPEGLGFLAFQIAMCIIPKAVIPGFRIHEKSYSRSSYTT